MSGHVRGDVREDWFLALNSEFRLSQELSPETVSFCTISYKLNAKLCVFLYDLVRTLCEIVRKCAKSCAFSYDLVRTLCEIVCLFVCTSIVKAIW